ncbi:MAG: response regulator [Chloroflexi bacterium]|nr:response regulator [Chloroflexota bacterium]
MVDAFSTGEVAQYCGVSRVTVWKWIKRGLLQGSRDAVGRYTIPAEAFRRFLVSRDYPVDPLLLQRSKRVLVVDDESALVEIIERALRQIDERIEVATAEDGFEAGLQTATFQPDLLILDLMMPRLDGFQVCRLIRQDPATAHIKILVVTAYGSRENVQRALAAGADALMHKPIEINRLRRQVSALLGLDS